MKAIWSTGQHTPASSYLDRTGTPSPTPAPLPASRSASASSATVTTTTPRAPSSVARATTTSSDTLRATRTETRSVWMAGWARSAKQVSRVKTQRRYTISGKRYVHMSLLMWHVHMIRLLSQSVCVRARSFLSVSIFFWGFLCVCAFFTFVSLKILNRK